MVPRAAVQTIGARQVVFVPAPDEEGKFHPRTVQVGAAIGGHEGVLAQAHSARGKRHAENLTPTIDFVRRQARVDLREIGCVAVDLGPGLYTGLRVGIASAKAPDEAPCP